MPTPLLLLCCLNRGINPASPGTLLLPCLRPPSHHSCPRLQQFQLARRTCPHHGLTLPVLPPNNRQTLLHTAPPLCLVRLNHTALLAFRQFVLRHQHPPWYLLLSISSPALVLRPMVFSLASLVSPKVSVARMLSMLRSLSPSPQLPHLQSTPFATSPLTVSLIPDICPAKFTGTQY